MDTYIEFCIHFWEATKDLDLYSMDGSQLDRIIVDVLLKTNEGKELLKTSMNELSVLIRAINHNNRKIQQPSLPSNLDEAAEEYANTHYGEFFEVEYEFGDPIETIVDDKPFVRDAFKAGAKWMAEQGETQGHFVIGSIADSPCGPAVVCYTEEFEIGDQVIVQIRKKEENHE